MLQFLLIMNPAYSSSFNNKKVSSICMKLVFQFKLNSIKRSQFMVVFSYDFFDTQLNAEIIIQNVWK